MQGKLQVLEEEAHQFFLEVWNPNLSYHPFPSLWLWLIAGLGFFWNEMERKKKVKGVHFFFSLLCCCGKGIYFLCKQAWQNGSCVCSLKSDRRWKGITMRKKKKMKLKHSLHFIVYYSVDDAVV